MNGPHHLCRKPLISCVCHLCSYSSQMHPIIHHRQNGILNEHQSWLDNQTVLEDIVRCQSLNADFSHSRHFYRRSHRIVIKFNTPSSYNIFKFSH